MKFTWTSFKKAQTVRTVGSSLRIDLPLLGIEGLKAKVDTGAFNGSLHVNRIREVKDKQGVTHLRFCPLGSPGHTIEIDSYHKRRVKSSNGLTDSRYAIDTEVGIRGQVYPITLTLTNRSAMRYPMLIGRNFLRLHGFLVDVNHANK
ncbi:MAG TPA: RimK/LysX family protein [Candidatus Dormibacteraeota bacterium]|nr:RimK/LysX family protein [Candidatus Dormibacteraeota bacterium]